MNSMFILNVLLIICLLCQVAVLVNINTRKKRLCKFIKNYYYNLFTKHSYITKLVDLTEETELTKEIKKINKNLINCYEGNEMLSSQRTKAEYILANKVNELIEQLASQQLSEELSKVVDDYKELIDKFNSDKKMYNEFMQEFMNAFKINPTLFYEEYKNAEQNNLIHETEEEKTEK